MRGRLRTTWVLAALAFSLAGCKEPLDSKKPLLERPQALPVFSAVPDRLETWSRASELTKRAQKEMAAQRWTAALPLLAEAVQVSPAHPDARLNLALLYDRAGLGSVAIQLLKPFAAPKAECGPCRYAMKVLVESKDFERLRETEAGEALLKDLPACPNLHEAADKLATALQKADPEAATAFASGGMGFDLIRSCPSCPTPQQQALDHRPLRGASMMARLALRFDNKATGVKGTQLLIGTPKNCEGLCCRWPVAEPVPSGQAALEHVCVLPDGATEVVATEVALVYGAGNANPRRTDLPGVPILPSAPTPVAAEPAGARPTAPKPAAASSAAPPTAK